MLEVGEQQESGRREIYLEDGLVLLADGTFDQDSAVRRILGDPCEMSQFLGPQATFPHGGTASCSYVPRSSIFWIGSLLLWTLGSGSPRPAASSRRTRRRLPCRCC